MLESVPPCRWLGVLGGPKSNLGRLVGPENDNMAGRKSNPLLVELECILVQMDAAEEFDGKLSFISQKYFLYLKICGQGSHGTN